MQDEQCLPCCGRNVVAYWCIFLQLTLPFSLEARHNQQGGGAPAPRRVWFSLFQEREPHVVEFLLNIS